MVTFLICLSLLVAAYFCYGAYLDRICKIDAKAAVPSATLYDGVDYIPMPRWRTFLIQLLNIAGIGPIFGAIMGACFGPVVFLWITFGGIFVGAMHDYISGIILLRNDGLSLPEIVGRYLGGGMLQFMRAISLVLLILVGVVFMRSPASILGDMITTIPYWGWIAIILVYYFVATMLPIDKLIGKIYPLFGGALIFMAVGLAVVLVVGDYTIPNLTFETLRNYQANAEAMPIIPTLFITVACGAISGFHATQSPLMARCMRNENESRVVFYGAMISESVIALIWAAIGMAFWGGVEGLNGAIGEYGGKAAVLVDKIATSTLGNTLAYFVIFGVVACAITSGDTAFRSARLIAADMFGIEQKSISKRLWICFPVFALGLGIILLLPFGTIWSYFAWANQALAVFTLWTITVWLHHKGKNIWIALIPALVMTYVCSSYIFVSPLMCGLSNRFVAYSLGAVLAIAISAFMLKKVFTYGKK
jgi:carbon starvation protein CstA